MPRSRQRKPAAPLPGDAKGRRREARDEPDLSPEELDRRAKRLLALIAKETQAVQLRLGQFFLAGLRPPELKTVGVTLPECHLAENLCGFIRALMGRGNYWEAKAGFGLDDVDPDLPRVREDGKRETLKEQKRRTGKKTVGATKQARRRAEDRAEERRVNYSPPVICIRHDQPPEVTD
jgi:hypothetical protein